MRNAESRLRLRLLESIPTKKAVQLGHRFESPPLNTAINHQNMVQLSTCSSPKSKIHYYILQKRREHEHEGQLGFVDGGLRGGVHLLRVARAAAHARGPLRHARGANETEATLSLFEQEAAKVPEQRRFVMVLDRTHSLLFRMLLHGGLARAHALGNSRAASAGRSDGALRAQSHGIAVCHDALAGGESTEVFRGLRDRLAKKAHDDAACGRPVDLNVEKNLVRNGLEVAGGQNNVKMVEHFKTAKKEKEQENSNPKVKGNKSLSDGQEEGHENFGDDEQGNSEHDADESNTNIMEKFRQVMKDRFKDGSFENKTFGPPPEELIRKTASEAEPVKTGAPIAFVKFQRLIGQERIEKMNPDNDKKEAPPETSSSEIPQANTISEYILNARDANLLVYCRFGDRYLNDMERRQKSVITALN